MESPPHIKILQDLQCLSEAKEDHHAKWCATTQQICHSLKAIFGQSVSILCPVHEADECQLGGYQILQAIHCVQLIGDLTEEKRRQPIIILWRTNEDVQTQSNMRAGPHWQSYVILPKPTKCLGKQIGEDHPVLYFKDTLNKRSNPCQLLIQLLEAPEGSTIIGGWFPKLQKINCNTDHCAHQRQNDSGFWLLYFSVRLVLDAETKFWHWDSITIQKGRKLRTIFGKVGRQEPKQQGILKHSEQTRKLAKDIQMFLYQKLVQIIKSFNEPLSQKAINTLSALNFDQLIRIIQFLAFKNQQSSLKEVIDKIEETKDQKDCFLNGIVSYAVEDIIQTRSLTIRQDVKHETTDGNSFTDLLRSDFYVDKSLFLERILKKRRIYISRPRGWGKTMLFQMAFQFFGLISVSERAQRINIFTGEQYQGHKFKKLKIADNQQIMKQFGVWPVIRISFDVELFSSQCFKPFMIQIQKEFQRHSQDLVPYLRQNKAIVGKIDYELYIKILKNQVTAEDDAINSLSFLVRLLFSYWKKKVIVLIDNADIFINSTKNDKGDRQRKNFQKGWLKSCFENTDSIETALLFGNMGSGDIFQVGKMNSSAIDSSNITLYTEDCGFTEDQMDELCQRVIGNTNWMAQKKLMQEWYNGFEVGGVTLYNSYLIIQCLANCKQKGQVNYEEVFMEQHNAGVIYALLKQNTMKWRQELIELINQGETTIKKTNWYWTIKEVNFFEHFCLLLVKQGYLVPTKKIESKTTYKIPNNHVKKKLYSMVCLNLLHFEDGEDLVKAINKMVENFQDAKMFQAVATQMCDRIPTDKEINQAYFNSTFGTMIQLASLFFLQSASHRAFFEIQAERRKRMDNLFIPLPGQSGTVIIHEYKIIRLKENQLVDPVVQNAIWQILVKGYLSTAFKKKNIEKQSWNEIISRAVVFYTYGKKWQVATKEFIHSFEQADQLISIFRRNENDKQPEKAEFLRQYGFQTIQDFLQSGYSAKERKHFKKTTLEPLSYQPNVRTRIKKKAQTFSQKNYEYRQEIRKKYKEELFKKIREQLLPLSDERHNQNQGPS